MVFSHLRLLLVFSFLFLGIDATLLTLQNRCRDTVFPGIQTGSVNSQFKINGGFELGPGKTFGFNVSSEWAWGRFWGRRGCTFDSSRRGTCVTGDCGGMLECADAGDFHPVTLAEFISVNGVDFYHVSLFYGYNMPVSIIPSGGSGACNSTSCMLDLNRSCPKGLEVRRDGRVVVCSSACLAFNTPQYCCTGDYATPITCNPSSYSKVFKAACPTAYSYANDDPTSMFTCKGANYLIRFC